MHSKAIKDYSSGDLITRSESLVHVIHNRYKQKRCDNCYGFQSLKKCSNCKQMFYCNKNCQKNDWIYHKNECKLFSRHGSDIARVENREPIDEKSKPIERLLLRLLLLLKNNESFASKAYQLTDNSVLSLNDIKINDKLIEMNSKSKTFFDYLVKRFKGFGIEFSEELLFRLYSITIRYSLTLSNTISYIIETIVSLNPEIFEYLVESYDCCGLFIPLIVYSHSCSPNTIHVLNGNTVELRANQEIKTGEEITVGFIDLSENREKRRKYLRDHYLFDCHCIRCETHSDKGFDFNEVKVRLDRISYLKERNDRKSFVLSIDLYERLIESMKLIVCETNPKLIFHYFGLLEMKFYCLLSYHCIDRQEIVDLIELISKIMKISYGTDHPFIDSFNKYIIIHKTLSQFNN